MTNSPTVAGEHFARDSNATIPAELLAIAQSTRATFGDGVRLKFAAWEGGSAGNPAYDDPGYDPRDSLEAKRRAGDVVQPDFDTGAADGVTVAEHQLPEQLR